MTSNELQHHLPLVLDHAHSNNFSKLHKDGACRPCAEIKIVLADLVDQLQKTEEDW